MRLNPTKHYLLQALEKGQSPTYLWTLDDTQRLLWAKGGVVPLPETRARYLTDTLEASHPHAIDVEDSEEYPEWRGFVVGTPDGVYELREVILYRQPLREAEPKEPEVE
jgi:hypothetical protein